MESKQKNWLSRCKDFNEDFTREAQKHAQAMHDSGLRHNTIMWVAYNVKGTRRINQELRKRKEYRDMPEVSLSVSNLKSIKVIIGLIISYFL